jgi:Fe-S cluster assembly ATP-binding protein
MLTIQNLKVQIKDKVILHGINLNIKPGEVHAIMGPNGSGKSTLAHVLAGREDIEVLAGSIVFDGVDLLSLAVEARAALGIFLGLQNPIEIPGVNNMYFLRTALNIVRTKQKKPELDAFDFMNLIKEKTKFLGLDESFLRRAVNDGFSGGEKKRNEILQMLLLEPRCMILDEIDSGLDIDALQVVSKGVNSLLSPERSLLMVTHYQRLLKYIVPDYVHVLFKGQIVASGGKELADELEQKGYAWLEEKK